MQPCRIAVPLHDPLRGGQGFGRCGNEACGAFVAVSEYKKAVGMPVCPACASAVKARASAVRARRWG
jgi:hypothetical protein